MMSTQELISGYTDMVFDRLLDDWEPTALAFMFNALRGTPNAIAKQMEDGVVNTYSRALTRVMRDHRQDVQQLPLWIACPDFPVVKHEKDNFRDIALNGGRHMHGIALTPRSKRRIAGSFADHVDEMQKVYAGPHRPLFRLHAQDISRTPEVAVDYMFKALKTGRADADDIIVLPRSHSEVR